MAGAGEGGVATSNKEEFPISHCCQNNLLKIPMAVGSFQKRHTFEKPLEEGVSGFSEA